MGAIKSGLVARTDTDRLVSEIAGADPPKVVVLHGQAGVGKSTIATEALREIGSRGWYVAAVRMDTASGARTAKALGTVFELSESPTLLLAGVADGAPAALLVDQLDAVSVYSGRMAGSLEAVDDLIEQAEANRLTIVLVVRTVDLESDSRLRRLRLQAQVRHVEVGLLDPADVRASLTRLGLDHSEMAQATLELLRVPLHFRVFADLPRTLSGNGTKQSQASSRNTRNTFRRG